MWISELSERTGIPVDTIKHYLRIGVLPKGESQGPLRAEYDDSHVSRLRLIQAMTDVGDLKLDSVRRIFESVDQSRASLRNAVGAAHYELSRRTLDDHEPSPEALAVVDGVIERRGWDIEENTVHRRALAVSIDALTRVDGLIKVPGRTLENLLDLYAEHMDQVARVELGYVDTSSRDAAIRSVVIGTVLYEPLLLLLRRLAQQHASRDWSAEADWLTAPDS